MSLENIEKELEEEFCEVGIDIEGNLVILERCLYFSFLFITLLNIY